MVRRRAARRASPLTGRRRFSKRASAEANFKLGSYQLVSVREQPPLWIANLLVVGDDGAPSEAAVVQALTNLASRANALGAQVHIATHADAGGQWFAPEREQQFLALLHRVPQLSLTVHQQKTG